MRKKVSKIKYSFMNIDYLCPECHKSTTEKEKWFIPCSIEGWGMDYKNTCPHCGYSFDNTKMVMFPHVKNHFPEAPEALCELLDNTFYMTLNCNDCFAPACCWDEEIDETIIEFYMILTTEEKIKPQEALEALCEWVAGKLYYGRRFPDRALKKIRKLTGWEWYPIKIKEE